MTASTQLEAYPDCIELFDAALASAKGVDYALDSYKQAFELMQRMHKARALDRDKWRELREPSDPLFGVSPYDVLVVRLPRAENNKWWLRIEPRALNGQIKEVE